MGLECKAPRIVGQSPQHVLNRAHLRHESVRIADWYRQVDLTGQQFPLASPDGAISRKHACRQKEKVSF
jgi:hypothetical protein